MLLAVGLAVTITACATPTSSASTVAADGGTPGATVPPGSPSCISHVVADESANGSTVCVIGGSDLTVLLHTTAGSGWSTPEVTGDALGPARPVPTPAGSVGWSFQAVAAGTAEVSTSRPVCPSAGSGAAKCHSVVGYLLHVKVGSR